jgi:hypothetical protein
MFYFSGEINGKYLKNEVKQLSLFMSRVKVRFLPVRWGLVAHEMQYRAYRAYRAVLLSSRRLLLLHASFTLCR